MNTVLIVVGIVLLVCLSAVFSGADEGKAALEDWEYAMKKVMESRLIRLKPAADMTLQYKMVTRNRVRDFRTNGSQV